MFGIKKIITAVTSVVEDNRGILQMMVGYKTPDPITENRENSGHFDTDGLNHWWRVIEPEVTDFNGTISNYEEE